LRADIDGTVPWVDEVGRRLDQHETVSRSLSERVSDQADRSARNEARIATARVLLDREVGRVSMLEDRVSRAEGRFRPYEYRGTSVSGMTMPRPRVRVQAMAAHRRRARGGSVEEPEWDSSGWAPPNTESGSGSGSSG
jgi:hypothetical protein